jgi:hypothetical protein
MPSIITATQLRTVLGVSSALYNDAYLDDIIDTSEAVILPLLNQWQAAVVQHLCEDEIETIYTLAAHNFSVGDVVDISGVGIHSLQNKTILTVPNKTSFTITHAVDDHVLQNVIPSGLVVPNSATSYVGVAAVESAIIVVSVEVFQSRTAPGGQIEGLDFTPSPYRMGRSLFNRVVGLLGPYIDVETMAQ